MYDFDFTEYCWSFYGPGQLYGEFFFNSLTREELDAAVKERQASPHFECEGGGDTFDREAVRDIMLAKREALSEACRGKRNDQLTPAELRARTHVALKRLKGHLESPRFITAVEAIAKGAE